MRLLGYNSVCSKASCFMALHQLMRNFCLYHHIPTMYQRKAVNTLGEIKSHCAKGQADIENLINLKKYTGMKNCVDTDLGQDLPTRRSSSSTLHEYNEVVFGWTYIKQSSKIDCMNGLEIKALFKGTKWTLIYRKSLESLGRPLLHPTLT